MIDIKYYSLKTFFIFVSLLITNTLPTDFIGKAIDSYDSIEVEPSLSIKTNIENENKNRFQ